MNSRFPSSDCAIFLPFFPARSSSTGFSLCSVDGPQFKPHRLKRLRKKLFISVPQAPEPAIFSNSRDLPLGSGIAVIDGDQIKRYFVDHTTDGRLRVAEAAR